MKNVKRIEGAGDENGVGEFDPEFDEVIDELELDENL